MFFRVHSSNIMGTSGSILSTLKTQTSNRDESSSNVSTRTIKRNDANSSVGISYCCFDVLVYLIVFSNSIKLQSS